MAVSADLLDCTNMIAQTQLGVPVSRREVRAPRALRSRKENRKIEPKLRQIAVSKSTNNKSTGKIILDKLTGIMKEKNMTTESNGNTEASFGTLPVTSKTTTTIKVTSVQ